MSSSLLSTLLSSEAESEEGLLPATALEVHVGPRLRRRVRDEVVRERVVHRECARDDVSVADVRDIIVYLKELKKELQ